MDKLISADDNLSGKVLLIFYILDLKFILKNVKRR